MALTLRDEIIMPDSAARFGLAHPIGAEFALPDGGFG